MQNLTTKYLNQLLRFIFTFVLILVFAVIFVETSDAQSNRWTYNDTTADGIIVFIDKTSVERSGSEIRLWEKSIFPDGSYQINLSAWQCADKKTMVVISNIYTPQGKFDGTKNGNGWFRVVPDSIGEALYGTACEVDPLKTTVRETTPENIKVISKQANIRELPSMNAAIVKIAAKGTVFRLVEAEPDNGWYQIYTGNGETAWIHGNTVEFVISVPKNNSNKIKLPPSILNDQEEGQN